MSSYNKYKYKLETHLKTLCEENREYTNLYSSWALNKTNYTNILTTIQMNFPHYSLHDASHSESIITNIEMLLGEDRIQKLSPTDTWLILNCAYLHDFGMALLYSNIEKEWVNSNFQNYLINLSNSSDKSLKEASDYILNLKNCINNIDFEATWPIKIRRYATEIIADYFRGKHANITKEYLNRLETWKLDLTQNGLIHDRLIKLVGEISFLHNQNFEEVMKLDYISNGYNSDYIHPRFIAELIRLGDLLDLDNGRFCAYIEKVIGEIPYTSKIHKEKHKSTKHVLITPNKIEIRANCNDYPVYREIRNWISWLEEEIQNITIHWTEIAPKNLDGYAPKLTKKELLIKGNPDVNNLSSLSFKISQKKAFEIIEGSNLYENKLTFLREFVQNAVDASKIQLWRDLNEGLYDSWINKSLSDLTPFDIDEKIYENYKLKIGITNSDKEGIKVTISDRGTGISLESLKNMCNAGSSYNGSLKEEVLKMPSWLKPTGGFGIGMQSGFLVNDNFKVYTKSIGMNTLEIKFEPATLNGYISVRNAENTMKRGTVIEILVPEIKSFRYSFGSLVDEFMSNSYDIFSNHSLTFYNIIDFLHYNLKGNLFPIEIHSNETTEILQSFTKNDEFINENTIYKEDDKYLYYIPEDLSKMILWNKKDSVFMEVSINNIREDRYFNNNIFFKGVKLNKENIHINKGFNIIVDIHGFDTKETLKLDRSSLTDFGREKLYNIIKDSIDFYLNKLILKLDSKIEKLNNIDELKKSINLDVFSFIILCSKNDKLKNFSPKSYKNLLEDKEFEIKVLKLVDDLFKDDMIPFKQILDEYPNLKYINIDNFVIDEFGKIKYNYEEIIGILNSYKNRKKYPLIIIDKNFIDIIDEFIVSEIQYINNSKKDLFIYTIDNKNYSEKVKVDIETKIYFIKNLVINKKNLKKLKHGQNSIRCSIPAIDGYEKLALNKIYYRIYGEHNSRFRIISPITKRDSENLNRFNDKDSFINSIIERVDYNNLLDSTFRYQVSKDKLCKKELSKLYEKLIGEFFELMKKER
ncbi:ATP-binding protein [Clostridium perfringens]|uniref:HD domain-containing protein n=1 Tax=Clostridium perfringens TaxID=1502 RepID=UPI0024BD55ED|nr:ATP-binding protein [Clostridium perfringens]MDK0734009.1 ATP-binding protein [Clostridium perfringens]MDM0469813.1 ATP-binding protein [Clostridium perfringens]